MDVTHVFKLEASSSQTLLARVALLLSRRRLRPNRLSFVSGEDPRRCSLEFSVTCDSATAHRLGAQVAKLSDLLDLTIHASASRLNRSTSLKDTVGGPCATLPASAVPAPAT